jgi:hypothetical protein
MIANSYRSVRIPVVDPKTTTTAAAATATPAAAASTTLILETRATGSGTMGSAYAIAGAHGIAHANSITSTDAVTDTHHAAHFLGLLALPTGSEFACISYLIASNTFAFTVASAYYMAFALFVVRHNI